MTDVDAVARKCAQQIVDAAWHTAKRTPDTPMTREQVQAIIATALRERDAEWKGKCDALLAEVERLRGELSKTTGDHIFEMD